MRSLVLILACSCTVVESGGSDDVDEYEVTQNSVIPACAVDTWCIESPPPALSTKLLKAAWAINANDVYAVGNNGTILHRVNGTSWTAVPSLVDDNLRSVWASSSSDVWVGSQSGAVLHFDGSAWSQVATPSTSSSDVDAIWGNGPSDVWFAGSGVVFHWDGATFTSWGLPGALLGVSATGPRDAWVTGESAGLRHYTGGNWAPVTSATTGLNSTMLLAVVARASNDVWVTGPVPKRESSHWNGTRWTVFTTSNALFVSLSAVSTNDMWGVGQTKVGHWDGSMWTSGVPFGDSVALYSVAAIAGHAWIVGNAGFIAHRAF